MLGPGAPGALSQSLYNVKFDFVQRRMWCCTTPKLTSYTVTFDFVQHRVLFCTTSNLILYRVKFDFVPSQI